MKEGDHVVDLAFRVQGHTFPADHGYYLSSAISRVLPDVHADESIGIHPIRGRLLGGRQLALTDRSRLIIRAPTARLPGLIRLAGQRLVLNGSQLAIGTPTVYPLRPAAALASRLVVIRGFMEPDTFLEAARRQLAERQIDGDPLLIRRRGERSAEDRDGSRSEVVRRTLRIHDREVIGFAVAVTQLTAEDSLRLQEVGLGGRRRFGCGLFLPLRS